MIDNGVIPASNIGQGDSERMIMGETYKPKLSRRTTLKWMASAVPALTLAGCSPPALQETGEASTSLKALTDWPNVDLLPIDHVGYGKDPDQIDPQTPWPLTMTNVQLTACIALIDLLVVADAHGPAASAVGVHEFLNEWVSAPYPQQQEDRKLIVPGLVWLDQEAQQRAGKTFAQAGSSQQIAILDDLAFGADEAGGDLPQPYHFFRLIRQLTLAGYYTTPEGLDDLGYIGNQAIAGDYPGPSPDALSHLESQLAALNLTLSGSEQ